MTRVKLADTAEKGDRLATLRALRDRLSGEIDNCASLRDLASLSQRLMDVLERIADEERGQPVEEATARDEVARKRAEREAARSRSRSAAQRRK
jgi:hypothetical protein